MYLLTPSGIEEKSAMTAEFLKIKMQEYAALEAEIDQLRREAIQTNKQQLSLGLTRQEVRL
jgi:hypothetical protein